MGDRLDQNEDNRSASPETVCIILTIMAILAPILISINPLSEVPNGSFLSMIWYYSIYMDRGHFTFVLYGLLASFPITFPRWLFVGMMVRLYQGKTTVKRTLLVGVLEIAYLLVMCLIAIADYFTRVGQYESLPFPLLIPLPFLLVTGLLLLKFFPPNIEKSWIDVDESPWKEPEV